MTMRVRTFYEIYKQLREQNPDFDDQTILETAKKQFMTQLQESGVYTQLDPRERLLMDHILKTMQPSGEKLTYQKTVEREKINYPGIGIERLGLPAMDYEAEPGSAKYTALEAARGAAIGFTAGLGQTTGGWLMRKAGLLDKKAVEELQGELASVGHGTEGIGKFLVEATKTAAGFAPAAAEAFGYGGLVAKQSAKIATKGVEKMIQRVAALPAEKKAQGIQALAKRLGMHPEQAALLVERAATGADISSDVALHAQRILTGKQAFKNIGLAATAKLPQQAVTGAAFALASSDIGQEGTLENFGKNFARDFATFVLLEPFSIGGHVAKQAILSRGITNQHLATIIKEIRKADRGQVSPVLVSLLKDIPLTRRIVASGAGNAVPIGGLALIESVVHGRSLPEALGAAVGIHLGGQLTGHFSQRAHVGYEKLTGGKNLENVDFNRRADLAASILHERLFPLSLQEYEKLLVNQVKPTDEVEPPPQQPSEQKFERLGDTPEDLWKQVISLDEVTAAIPDLSAEYRPSVPDSLPREKRFFNIQGDVQIVKVKKPPTQIHWLFGEDVPEHLAVGAVQIFGNVETPGVPVTAPKHVVSGTLIAEPTSLVGAKQTTVLYRRAFLIPDDEPGMVYVLSRGESDPFFVSWRRVPITEARDIADQSRRVLRTYGQISLDPKLTLQGFTERDIATGTYEFDPVPMELMDLGMQINKELAGKVVAIPVHNRFRDIFELRLFTEPDATSGGQRKFVGYIRGIQKVGNNGEITPFGFVIQRLRNFPIGDFDANVIPAADGVVGVVKFLQVLADAGKISGLPFDGILQKYERNLQTIADKDITFVTEEALDAINDKIQALRKAAEPAEPQEGAKVLEETAPLPPRSSKTKPKQPIAQTEPTPEIPVETKPTAPTEAIPEVPVETKLNMSTEATAEMKPEDVQPGNLMEEPPPSAKKRKAPAKKRKVEPKPLQEPEQQSARPSKVSGAETPMGQEALNLLRGLGLDVDEDWLNTGAGEEGLGREADTLLFARQKKGAPEDAEEKTGTAPGPTEPPPGVRQEGALPPEIKAAAAREAAGIVADIATGVENRLGRVSEYQKKRIGFDEARLILDEIAEHIHAAVQYPDNMNGVGRAIIGLQKLYTYLVNQITKISDRAYLLAQHPDPNYAKIGKIITEAVRKPLSLLTERGFKDVLETFVIEEKTVPDSAWLMEFARQVKAVSKLVYASVPRDSVDAEWARIVRASAEALHAGVAALDFAGAKMLHGIESLKILYDLSSSGVKHKDVIATGVQSRPLQISGEWRRGVPNWDFTSTRGLLAKEEGYSLARSMASDYLSMFLPKDDVRIPPDLQREPQYVGQSFVKILRQVAASRRGITPADVMFFKALKGELGQRIAKHIEVGEVIEAAALIKNFYLENRLSERTGIPVWVYDFESLAFALDSVSQAMKVTKFKELVDKKTGMPLSPREQLARFVDAVLQSSLITDKRARLADVESRKQGEPPKYLLAYWAMVPQAMKKDIAGVRIGGTTRLQKAQSVDLRSLEPRDLYAGFEYGVRKRLLELDGLLRQVVSGQTDAQRFNLTLKNVVFEWTSMLYAINNALYDARIIGESMHNDLNRALDDFVNHLSGLERLRGAEAAQTSKGINTQWFRGVLAYIIENLSSHHVARVGVSRMAIALDAINEMSLAIRNVATVAKQALPSHAIEVQGYALSLLEKIYGRDQYEVTFETKEAKLLGRTDVDTDIMNIRRAIESGDRPQLLSASKHLHDKMQADVITGAILPLFFTDTFTEKTPTGEQRKSVSINSAGRLGQAIKEYIQAHYPNLATALKERRFDENAIHEARKASRDIALITHIFGRASRFEFVSRESMSQRAITRVLWDWLLQMGEGVLPGGRFEQFLSEFEAINNSGVYERLFNAFPRSTLHQDKLSTILLARALGIEVSPGFVERIQEIAQGNVKQIIATIDSFYAPVAEKMNSLIMATGEGLKILLGKAGEQQIRALEKLIKDGDRTTAISLAEDFSKLKDHLHLIIDRINAHIQDKDVAQFVTSLFMDATSSNSRFQAFYREIFEGKFLSTLAERDYFSDTAMVIRELRRAAENPGYEKYLKELSSLWTSFDTAYGDLLAAESRRPTSWLLSPDHAEVKPEVAAFAAFVYSSLGRAYELNKLTPNLDPEVNQILKMYMGNYVTRLPSGQYKIDISDFAPDTGASLVKSAVLRLQDIDNEFIRSDISQTHAIADAVLAFEFINFLAKSGGPIYPLLVRAELTPEGRRVVLDTRPRNGYEIINNYIFNLYQQLGYDRVPVVFAMDSTDTMYVNAAALASVRAHGIAKHIAKFGQATGISEVTMQAMRDLIDGRMVEMRMENEADVVAWGYLLGTRSVESLNAFVVRDGRVITHSGRKIGTINAVDPGAIEIASKAISSAVRDGDTVVFAHTHPGGMALPSKSDIHFTKEQAQRFFQMGAKEVVSIITDGVFATIIKVDREGAVTQKIVPIPEDAVTTFQSAAKMTPEEAFNVTTAKLDNSQNAIALFNVAGRVIEARSFVADTRESREILDTLTNSAVAGELTLAIGFNEISDVGLHNIAILAAKAGKAHILIVNNDRRLLKRFQETLTMYAESLAKSDIKLIFGAEAKVVKGLGNVLDVTIITESQRQGALAGFRQDAVPNVPTRQLSFQEVRKAILDRLGRLGDKEDDLSVLTSDVLGDFYRQASAVLSIKVKPKDEGSLKKAQEMLKEHQVSGETKKEKIIRKIFDEGAVFRKLDEIRSAAVGELPYELSVYDHFSSIHNKVGGLLTIIDTRIKEPMTQAINELTKRGYSYEEISQFVLANHVLEVIPVIHERILERAKEQMAAVKPGERSERIKKRIWNDAMERLMKIEVAGFKMSDAKELVQKNLQGRDGKIFKQLLDKVEELSKFRVLYALSTGLIAPEDATSLLLAYKHYVPLLYQMPQHELRNYNEDIKRFGNFSKVYVADEIFRETSEGNAEIVKDPIAALFSDTARLIIAGQNNLLLNALAGAERVIQTRLVQVRYPKSYAELEEIAPVINLAEDKVNFGIRPEIMHFKFLGQDAELRIFDPRIYRALHGVGVYQAWPIIRAFSAITNFMVMLRTGLSPAFWVTNFGADVMSASMFLRGEYGKEYQKKFLGNLRSAFMESWKANIEKTPSQEFIDFLGSGGRVTTGLIHEYGYENMLKRLSQLDRQEGGFGKDILESARNMRELMLSMADTFELATRFAVYRTGLEMGLSRERAAQLAAEVTVNFSRKGELAPSLNAFYMFFKADAAALHRGLRALALAKGIRRLVRNSVIFGIVLSMINRMLTDEGDGQSAWDRLSEDQKSRYLHLFVGRGENGEARFIKVRSPHFFRSFISLGQRLEKEVLYPLLNPDIQVQPLGILLGMMDAMLAFASSFNPFSALSFASPKAAVVSLSPSAFFRQAAALATNTSVFGGRIYPERMPWNELTPSHAMAFKSTNPLLVGISRALSEATSPAPNIRGKIDIPPEVMQFLINEAAGGLGEFIGDIMSTGTFLLLGQAPPIKTVPLLKRFGTVVGDEYYTGKYYELRRALQDLGKQIEAGKRMKNSNAILGARKVITEFDKKISALTKAKAAAERQHKDVEHYDKQIVDLQKRAVKKVLGMINEYELLW